MLRHKRRVVLVAGSVGALLGLVVSLAVTSPASAVHVEAVGAGDGPNATATGSTQAPGSGRDGEVAERVASSEANVLTINSQRRGQFPWVWPVFVRVGCTNNFDGDPSNNTVPGPTSYPSDPDPVDGYVYLVFSFESDRVQRVLDAETADANDSCTVQQTESSSGLEVEYAATSDDPDTIVETQQPPPGLGFAKVTWPTGAVDPVGDSAEVTITTRSTPCPGGQQLCYVDGSDRYQVRIKVRIRGDAPDQPSFTLRVRCSGGGVMEETLLTVDDETSTFVHTAPTRNRCVLKEVDTGGADRVEYFARSATADTSFGPNSARVDFGNDDEVGESALLRVTNRYEGSCPSAAPPYC